MKEKSGNVAEGKLYTLNRKASDSIEGMGGGISVTSHIWTENISPPSAMFNSTKDECCTFLSNKVWSEWEKEKLSY